MPRAGEKQWAVAQRLFILSPHEGFAVRVCRRKVRRLIFDVAKTVQRGFAVLVKSSAGRRAERGFAGG